jgi:hypothetical protein
MDLTYAERRLLGRKIRQAVTEISQEGPSPAGRMCCRAIIPSSSPGLGIIIAATTGVGPQMARKGMPDFVRLVRVLRPVRQILWINIRENSPKYQFLYFPMWEGDFSHHPALVAADPRTIAAWVAHTPEAKY